jgi:hypothetical protein
MKPNGTNFSALLPLPQAGEGWGEGGNCATHVKPILTPALSRTRERE